MTRPEISGHRGSAGTHPENTLTGFRAAIDAGADGVELDVRLSADGVPVVLHDDTVDRTTDGTGPVRRFTVPELRSLDAGSGEYVPTLAEVLALTAGRVEVNVELKDADAVDAVLAVAAGIPGVRAFFSSFDWDALRALRRADPRARIYPTGLGGPLDTLHNALRFAEEIAAEGLSLRQSRLDAADIVRVHAAGLRVWAWTVNDPARAAQLAAWGADVLCTDAAALLLPPR